MMDVLFIIILLISSFILIFISNWVKVALFMWGANIKGSSFKMTFAYLLGKTELENLKD